MKILIVEDVNHIAFGAQVVLGAHGHEADIALTPSEARQAMLERQYDAIFMDFGLPEVNGLDLSSEFKNDEFPGLIIGLTANRDAYTIEEMQAAGLNSCLEKPLTPQKLSVLDMKPEEEDFNF